MQQAYEMAVEALGLFIIRYEAESGTSRASRPQDIKVSRTVFWWLLSLTWRNIEECTVSKAIKKTLSIPEW